MVMRDHEGSYISRDWAIWNISRKMFESDIASDGVGVLSNVCGMGLGVCMGLG